MELQISLPDDIAIGLKIPPQKIEEEILREAAITFYIQGKASMGVARRLSGLGKREFLDELAKRKITRHYSEKDANADIKYAKSHQ